MKDFEDLFNKKYTDKSFNSSEFTGKTKNLSITCNTCLDVINTTPTKALKSIRCSCNSWTTKSMRSKFTKLYEEYSYDFSESIYNGSHGHISFKCPKHGVVSRQGVHTFKEGIACPLCKREVTDKAQSYGYEYFLGKAKEVHGDNYNYIKDSYVSFAYNISFICTSCGCTLTKRIDSHINKKVGCRCFGSIKSEYTLDEIRCKLNSNQFSNYTYEIAKDFKESSTIITLTCKKHNTKITNSFRYFLKDATHCPDCLTEKSRKNTPQYLEELEERFPNTYSSNEDTVYSLSTNVINLTCNKCLVPFSKRAYQVLQGNGCNNCSPKSKPEEEIRAYIKSLLPNIKAETSRPKWLGGKELDIYIPDNNLAIEYNGSTYHHSSNSEYISEFYKSTSKPSSYHFNKWKTCFDNEIILLSIYDFYWKNPIKKEIYKSKIRHYLGLDTKLYARKCKVREIGNTIANSFYEENHLEGKGFPYKDSRSYGLFFNDTLVMCATVGDIYNQSTKSFKKKLNRICTLKDFTVIGGISKLSKFLLRTFGDYSYQITLSSGGSSLKSTSDYKVIQPRYFWVNSKDVSVYYHRNSCQKHLLEKRFSKPLLDNDTESTYMERLGYLKVYDNGLAELKIVK